jgi:hypothetical protein
VTVYLALPLAAAGLVLFCLEFVHGLRMVTHGEQATAGHVLLAALGGLLMTPIVASWAG